VACERLHLRQVVFFTKTGVFRCDVRTVEGETILVAETWIALATIGDRDRAVIEDLAGAFMAWEDGASDLDRWLGCKVSAPAAPEGLIAALVLALGRHQWLRDEYVERHDPLTELWNAAREQAEQAN
jgi:hypothetical protein